MVTSATAVRLLVEEFARVGRDAKTVFGSLSLAAVGEKTARALAEYAPGQSQIVVPPVSNSVALGKLLAERLAHQPLTKLVLCRGLEADAQLPMLLAGTELSCYSIYRTGAPTLFESEIAALQLALAVSGPPLTILVSSLAIGRNLLDQVRRHLPGAVERLLDSRVIAIGPGTATGLRALGFTKVETAPAQSVEAMIAIL